MSVTDASTNQRNGGPAGPPARSPEAAPDPCRSQPLHDREAPARRTLRRQVAKLDRELARCVARARACDAIDWSVPAPAPYGPRLLDLGELEQLRDDLAERLHEVRETLAARAVREAERRALLERMLRDPAEHRFLRITRAEVGEPGCGAWESRPRLGLIGMLAGWWHVKISSGCPLSLACYQF
jgi:hypothetical protein